ncbi:MAG: tetratricopeptide repeat protein, partial [Nitrospinota bacterium]|nr:tetratricopeptide repeat protein [Nitrospinota bacterium]
MRFAILLLMAAMAMTPATSLAQTSDSLVKGGDSYRDQYNNKDALDLYRKAVAADPQNLQAQTRLAQCLVDNGEDLNSNESEKYYQEAMELAGRITAKNPDLAEGHYQLALATGKMALFKGGKEKVKLSREVERSGVKALELDPNNSRGRILMGVYYREIANLNWALKMFANTFFGGLPKGTNEDAVRELKKALELNSRSIRARYELGKTYEEMGMKSEAGDEYKMATELPMADHLDP